MSLQTEAKKVRKPSVEISPLFYTRWSPRAMTGEKMRKEELLPLFEAARWAPSSYNNQPWRFVVALTLQDKEKMMTLLVDFNKQWCKNASALILICSSKVFDHNGEAAVTHSLDTGAAWMSLALEGARRGLVIHGMQGFDYDKAKSLYNIPSKYKIEAMVAIGHFAKAETLPADLAAREKPSSRKPLKEIVAWGEFIWD